MVPGLTFANAVVCIPGDVRDILERRQREVGRQALGCHGMVANEAVQGDLGWSSFEAREAASKIGYDGRLRLMDRGRKRLYQLEKKYGFFNVPVAATTEQKWELEVRKRVREEEAVQWSEAARSKTLVYRQRFDQQVQSTSCRVCGETEETIKHIVLSCPTLVPRHPVDWGQAPDNGLHLDEAHSHEQFLAEALGFRVGDTGRDAVCWPSADLNRAAVALQSSWKCSNAVERTKRRLEDWCHHHARRKVSLNPKKKKEENTDLRTLAAWWQRGGAAEASVDWRTAAEQPSGTSTGAAGTPPASRPAAA
ncbi:hypothetical protein HPB47_003443 [Ixodes persulcatus]|uniref:Uncharacterized protein n=1 Tax=Ixodes persulcatus TaxID=34615 RepID=A0AC60PIJ6_IXOPE|nr:hypothetical protein HPB47_003443 [Ixodes persulcatus]